MRLWVPLVIVLTLAAPASAACPPDCFAGGGPAITDCFVEWGGIAGASTSCVDGDPSCDTDGQADGTCTLALSACINVPGDALGCTAGALSAPPKLSPRNAPAVQGLAAALAALGTTGQACTPPGFTVPLKVAVGGVKPGKIRLKMTAVSGGKRDADAITLQCLSGSPSLARIQQDIFTPKCATSGCHKGAAPSAALSLENGKSYPQLVGQRSDNVPSLTRVTPFSVKRSFLARKILGKGIPGGTGGALMPLGLPRLTPAEAATVLEWIQAGAPNN
jgi:hypothetical protein